DRRVPVGARQDDRSTSTPEFDVACLTELGVGTQDGVHVDLERLREVARSRQSRAGRDGPAEDCRPYLTRDLRVDRFGGCGVDLHEHALVYSSSCYRTSGYDTSPSGPPLVGAGHARVVACLRVTVGVV